MNDGFIYHPVNHQSPGIMKEKWMNGIGQRIVSDLCFFSFISFHAHLKQVQQHFTSQYIDKARMSPKPVTLRECGEYPLKVANVKKIQRFQNFSTVELMLRRASKVLGANFLANKKQTDVGTKLCLHIVPLFLID